MRRADTWVLSLAAAAALGFGCGESALSENPPATDVLDVLDVFEVEVDASDTRSVDAEEVNMCGDGVPCRRDSTCREAGLDNHICGDDGCCITDTPRVSRRCEIHGQSCGFESDSFSFWQCDPDLRLCLSVCSVDAFQAGDPNFCPAGSACEPIDGPTNLYNYDTGLVLDGICQPNQCELNFDPQGNLDFGECDGLPAYDGVEVCGVRADCTCVSARNDTRHCQLQGPGQSGELCDEDNLCDAGLRCIADTCMPICDTRTAECDGDPTICPAGDDCRCIDLQSGLFLDADGICAVGCTEFSTGSCPADTLCRFLPSNIDSGAGTWACMPSPPGVGSLASDGERCGDVEGVSPVFTCAEGLACVEGAGPRGRGICAPQCQVERFTSVGRCPLGNEQVCLPVSGSAVGACAPRCDPYSDAFEPCGTGLTCNVVEPLFEGRPAPGGCYYVNGTAALDEPCDYSDKTLRPQCRDGLTCFITQGDTGTCRPRCNVLADERQCGEGLTCDGRFALATGGNSACIEVPNGGRIGDPCRSEFRSCADDGSICMDTEARGLICLGACRTAASGACGRDAFCDSIVPSYLFSYVIGLCVPYF
jgi:hypothetical protein